jgi:hypothetical protein
MKRKTMFMFAAAALIGVLIGSNSETMRTADTTQAQEIVVDDSGLNEKSLFPLGKDAKTFRAIVLLLCLSAIFFAVVLTGNPFVAIPFYAIFLFISMVDNEWLAGHYKDAGLICVVISVSLAALVNAIGKRMKNKNQNERCEQQ